jgi:hypothetical protein
VAAVNILTYTASGGNDLVLPIRVGRRAILVCSVIGGGFQLGPLQSLIGGNAMFYGVNNLSEKLVYSRLGVLIEGEWYFVSTAGDQYSVTEIYV